MAFKSKASNTKIKVEPIIELPAEEGRTSTITKVPTGQKKEDDNISLLHNLSELQRNVDQESAVADKPDELLKDKSGGYVDASD